MKGRSYPATDRSFALNSTRPFTMRASRGRRAVKGWNLFRRVVDVAAVVILAIYAVWGIAWYEGYCPVKPVQELWITMMVILVLQLVISFVPEKWTKRGESPFSIGASRSLAILSFTYLINAIVGTASADGLDVLVKASGWVFGYSFSPTEGFVDLGSIGACIAFACLAFVFRYGQMLQAVSDDTV